MKHNLSCWTCTTAAALVIALRFGICTNRHLQRHDSGAAYRPQRLRAIRGE